MAADLRQRLQATERGYDLRVELCAGSFIQRADGTLVAQRVAEGARAGHRVVVRLIRLMARPDDLVVLQGAHDRQTQVFVVPGLLCIAVDLPAVDGVCERLRVGVGSEDEPDHVRTKPRRLFEKLRAGHAGQGLVCNQQRHVVLREQAQRLLARRGAQNLVGGAEESFEPPKVGGLFVHDHHLLGHRRTSPSRPSAVVYCENRSAPRHLTLTRISYCFHVASARGISEH